jgi:Clp amino terminal domain, pathogenicity island component
MLVAISWEAGGIAAQALAEAGLPKGAEIELRSRLAKAPPQQRGTTRCYDKAVKIAIDRGHDYLGTEHQLLAILNDPALSELLFPAETRDRAGAYVHDVMTNNKY